MLRSLDDVSCFSLRCRDSPETTLTPDRQLEVQLLSMTHKTTSNYSTYGSDLLLCFKAMQAPTVKC